MENARVVYATRTQHSKKIAAAIAQALDTKAVDVTDNPRVPETELLFIVAGIYGGDSLPELLSFVTNLDPQKNKQVALVTSCASQRQGQVKVREILEEKGIEIADEFLCPGSFLFYRWGRPNRADIQGAVDFCLPLAGKIVKY